MWKFIVGYFAGVAVALAVVLAPAKAQVDPHIAWYAVGTFYLTPTEKGRVVFDTSSATKAECMEWLESKEYQERYNEILAYVEKTYKQGHFESTVCVQPPAERNPA